ncbi:thioredoxin 2 [Thermotomaculum hydrothermale]|uniref:Thioredoxin n=1 Tax=Thermotomaculum hydrothermale TaxID=981385 RepID=A0A7R6SY32_9BACT|nr:thioredoxin TrxC [Thermotomaculum hydrothermale]BBB32339.1 thioredoxin 2 [Thermotomaculum hydrothermale]
MHIVCPFCDTVNNVEIKGGAKDIKCGKCKNSLKDTHPVELNAQNFKKHIEKNDIPVVVDFWAPWCAPCLMMAPQFEEAAKHFPLKVRFAKLNSDNYPEIAGMYGIMGIPTMIVFKNGQELGRISGAMSAPQIIQWINSVIG